jgi:NTE family protein
MTPWNTDPDALRAQARQLPQDLVQALSLTLDWALLASYRVAFRVLTYRNLLAEAAEKLERAVQQTGDETLRLSIPVARHISMPTVIAPQELMPLEWIIDYEDANHRRLFEMGKVDAERALAHR